MPVEVEAQSLAQVDEALAAGADVVLIDNLSNEQTGEAIGRCRGRARTEVSGGVTLARVPALAALGPTYVSVGALTHSAGAVDLAQVDEALAAGADVVLIDNLSNEQTGEAIGRCRGRARTEVSGGVTLARVPALAALGPTYVSVGALTHSAGAVDISFEMAPAS
jgi:nicotinate-nucleotide pyrophosphorylase